MLEKFDSSVDQMTPFVYTWAMISEIKLNKIHRQMANPFFFRPFLLVKLPLAFFSGVRLKTLDSEKAQVTVPYGWRTQNPFRSTYFAALSMAAELSTGALVLSAVRASGRPIAMIITDLRVEFKKKANSLTTFQCEDGKKILDSVSEVIQTGGPLKVQTRTVGTLPGGEEVAEFEFTWSMKMRSGS